MKAVMIRCMVWTDQGWYCGYRGVLRMGDLGRECVAAVVAMMVGMGMVMVMVVDSLKIGWG